MWYALVAVIMICCAGHTARGAAAGGEPGRSAGVTCQVVVPCRHVPRGKSMSDKTVDKCGTRCSSASVAIPVACERISFQLVHKEKITRGPFCVHGGVTTVIACIV
jgi:hypothetical protein